jgi:hypothetical protein
MPPDVRPDVLLRNVIGRAQDNTPEELYSTARSLRDGDYQR